MKWRIWHIAVAIGMSCTPACKDMDDDAAVRKQVISEGVQIRLEEFRANTWNKCVEEAQRRAISRADSIMRGRAKMDAVDPVVKPPKPVRPPKPEVRSMPDSILQDLPPGNGQH